MNKCKICGKDFEDSPFYPNLHLCSQECHHIDFWNRTLDNTAIIIDGECYHDGGNKPNEKRGYLLGCAGRKFIIKFKDTGEIIETNNLWCNGTVPKERNIPDNAVFITNVVNNRESLF